MLHGDLIFRGCIRRKKNGLPPRVGSIFSFSNILHESYAAYSIRKNQCLNSLAIIRLWIRIAHRLRCIFAHQRIIFRREAGAVTWRICCSKSIKTGRCASPNAVGLNQHCLSNLVELRSRQYYLAKSLVQCPSHVRWFSCRFAQAINSLETSMGCLLDLAI